MAKHLLVPKQLITLDMDATLEDPWACCGGDSHKAPNRKPGCLHAREDVLEQVAKLQAEHPNAGLVIVSYRLGASEERTRRFLTGIEMDVAAVFHPDSKDTDLLRGKAKREIGHVSFKHQTVQLLKRKGCEVVASFDDNAKVCEAYRQLGVPHVVQVPYQVNPLPHEYTAGWIGAPKPKFDPKTWSGPWYGGDSWKDKEFVGQGSLYQDGGLWTDTDDEWLREMLEDDYRAEERRKRRSHRAPKASDLLGIPGGLSRLGHRWRNVPDPADFIEDDPEDG